VISLPEIFRKRKHILKKAKEPLRPLKTCWTYVQQPNSIPTTLNPYVKLIDLKSKLKPQLRLDAYKAEKEVTSDCYNTYFSFIMINFYSEYVFLLCLLWEYYTLQNRHYYILIHEMYRRLKRKCKQN